METDGKVKQLTEAVTAGGAVYSSHHYRESRSEWQGARLPA